MPLKILFKADSLERLRMDVSTVTGFYVGSALIQDGEFRAIVPRERKYYVGPSTPRAMKKVLKLPFDPVWFNRFLFEIPDPSWECKKSSRGYVESCIDVKNKMKISWQNRAYEKRNIVVEVDRYKANFYLSEFQPQIDEYEKAFVLNKPAKFRSIRIKR